MAKNMARIENGIVVNVQWCPDGMAETDTLKNTNDHPVGIGDTYADGLFYRDGEMVLSQIERLQAELQDMKTALETLGVRADG